MPGFERVQAAGDLARDGVIRRRRIGRAGNRAARERPGGASVAIEDVEPNLAHLDVAAARLGRIFHHRDAAQQIGQVRAAERLVGEVRERRVAVGERDRQRILGGKLRFEPRLRIIVAQQVDAAGGHRQHGAGAGAEDLRAERRMRVEPDADQPVGGIAARIQFQRHAIRPHRERVVIERRHAVAGTVHVDEADVALEDVVRAVDTGAGQPRGAQSGRRGEPGVRGFRHRAEVAFHAAGLRGRERERRAQLVLIETIAPAGRGGGGERAERSGRVPTLEVMTEADALTDRARRQEPAA